MVVPRSQAPPAIKMSSTSPRDSRTRPHARIRSIYRGASTIVTWHRLAPWPLLEDPALARIAEFLARPDVHAQLQTADVTREYPHAIRRELHSLGLSELFTGRGSHSAGPTIPHL